MHLFSISRARTIGIAAAIVLSAFTAAQACNVPVFRFALERWRADRYRVTLFHRGALAGTDQVLIAPLEQHDTPSSAVNLGIRTIDVSTLDDAADRELLASLGNPELPWFFVQYPVDLR